MKKILTMVALLVAMSCHAGLTPKGQKDTEITAKSWIVSSEGQILHGKNTTEVRSIGSITKLVTVMVYLDAHKSVTSKTDQELIQRTLVSSDNRAAKRLCEAYPGGKDDCIFMMNLKARELGLSHTKFIEPTGLSVFNISNAEELIKIVESASKYPEIVKASNTKMHNTNPLVGKHKFQVSKTGFINAAGGCIVAMQERKIVVILGSKNVRTRIPELEKLLKI
jgi:D-alanyl-D-alanine endopeptidase (penicillin-binding protein 7)